jgi:uncharacterized protein DUF5060/uncharacterized protein DUF4038/collagenase-like protein with putative collagen-binding domain
VKLFVANVRSLCSSVVVRAGVPSRTSAVLLVLALLPVTPLANAAPAPEAGPVTPSQWSTTEITLAASAGSSNPYTDTALTATFSGPNGITKTVQGFWDGGNTWRIRFTPTSQGIWNWSTSSSDPGLDAQSGFLAVGAPSPGNHGFLRRDATHPSTFVWDDGTRFLMWGQTYYEIVRNARAGGGWTTAIDNVAALGLTKVRLLVYPWGVGAPDNPYPDSQPFLGSPPDHDVLDLQHWQALDEVVQYLESKGMVADLVLFADAPRIFGTPTQDDRYTRYALARFGAFHNVSWALSNEWNYTDHPASYFDHLGAIVRGEDPWMSEGMNLRPLSVHQQTRIDFQFFGSSWPVHAIVQYGVRNGTYVHGDEWGNASIVHNLGHGMPVVNDEYSYLGESSSTVALTDTQHRRAIWGIATAGGYGSAGSDRVAANGSIPFLASDWNNEPEYGDVQRMISFFTGQGVAYWAMSSQNALGSGPRVYVLAAAGAEYVVYAAVGGTFTVDLAAGSYEAARFNPRDGSSVSLGTVPGGRVQSFTMPDFNDWVLHLKANAGQ